MYTIVLILLSLIVVWKIFFPVPEPILGVYSQPGNRGIFKQIFIYILLTLRKRKEGKSDNKDVGLGVKKTADIKELECVKVFCVKRVNTGCPKISSPCIN